jgi:hypothetical protein
MKCAFEMGSGAMTYIPSFMNSGSGIKKLMGEEKYTDTQAGDRISLLLFLQNKESRQTPDVYLAPFVDDTCICAAVRRERYVLRKLQRGLNSIQTWCEDWSIKVN